MFCSKYHPQWQMERVANEGGVRIGWACKRCTKQVGKRESDPLETEVK